MHDDAFATELREQINALREELRVLREDFADQALTREYMEASLALMTQMRELQDRANVEYDAWRRPRLEPEEEEDPPRQVGKLTHAEWATYEGFRGHLCKLEQQSRLPTTAVTKQVIAGMAGVSPRTITRHMTETWRLPARLWPPSTWPAHLAAGLIAAGWLAVTADLFDDKRLDHAVRFCQSVLHLVNSIT